MPQITRRTDVVDVEFHEVRPGLVDRMRVAWGYILAMPVPVRSFIVIAIAMIALMALTEPERLLRLDTNIAIFGCAAALATLTALGPRPHDQ